MRNPHPGDLIAWPGHVGIVVDPLQHSFYSLVRTGLEAQDYRSGYWRSRGIPRFYRYKVEQGAIVNAAKISGSSRVSNGRMERGGGTNAASKIKERPGDEYDSSDRPPAAISEKADVIYGPTAPAVSAVSKSPEPPFSIPARVMIATGNRRPTREEVTEAISELSDAGGSVLRTDDPMKAEVPVVIVEQIEVERVEAKRDRGWARLMIDFKVSIDGGEFTVKHHREKVRWELRRTDAGWEAITPQDRRYVQHDAAVKNLADQLARLAKSDGAAEHQPAVLRQEAQLAGLLNTLLQSK